MGIRVSRTVRIDIARFNNDINELIDALSAARDSGSSKVSLKYSLVPPGNIDQRESDQFWLDAT